MPSARQALQELEQHGGKMVAMLSGWLGSHVSEKVPAALQANEAWLEAQYLGTYPAVSRKLSLAGHKALLVYYGGAVNREEVERELIEALQAVPRPWPEDFAELAAAYLPALVPKHVSTWTDVDDEFVAGHVLLFVDGAQGALSFDLKQIPMRSLAAPKIEQSVRGPQVAFIEDLKTNLALIRDRLRSPRLKVWHKAVGIETLTQVAVLHLQGVTNAQMVERVQHTIATAEPKDLQIVSSITGLLEQRPYSLFPQLRMTQRIDEATRAALAGRMLIMMHGDPTVAIYPSTLGDFYRTMQDYMMTFWEASYVRILRLIATLTALYLPAFYVAATTVNPDLMPTRLAIVVAGSREGVPFSPIIEVVIMFIIVEFLREAALRMPAQMSSTLGTVGAIVVGTALVKAGIISDLMIVVATIAAVADFTAPSFEITSVWRILLWPMAVVAAIWGMIGIIALSFAVLASLASLEVAGQPYLAPLVPSAASDFRDAIVRLPVRSLGPSWRPDHGSLLRALGLGWLARMIGR